MTTQVIVETRETQPAPVATTIDPRYEELVAQFHQERSRDPRERARIERQILQTFQDAMAEIGVADEKSLAEEDLGDTIMNAAALANVGMTALSVGATAAQAAGVDAATAAHHVTSTAMSAVLNGVGMGATSGILLVLSLYNLYRVIETRQRLEEAEEDLVKWEKYYIDELDKAEKEAMDAVNELVKYFVHRESLLRMNDASQSTTISYELGMQMARCMHRIERALKRYRELIEKGEETLQAIEDHAEVLEERAKRQKRRGWVAVVSGGLTVIGGIGMIAMSGGAALPVAAMILGAAVTATGGAVVYLSSQQLEKLRKLKKNIGTAKDQILRHRAHCDELEQMVMEEIQKAEEFVTEAEKHSLLEAQLEEARRQNEAMRRRMEAVAPQRNDHEVQEMLNKHRLGKFFDAIVNELGLETVDDLEEIDDEMLVGIGCKPIDTKKFRRMLKEIQERRE